MKKITQTITTSLFAFFAAIPFAPSLALAAAETEGDHASRGLMDLVWHEMLWTIIVFAIFFGVLSTVVWPKILGALKAREEKQRTDLKSAETAAADAAKTLTEYKAQLAEAQKEAGRIIDEARIAADQVAARIKADAESDAIKLRDRVTNEIETAKTQAIGDIYAQAAVLSTQVAGRILSREINADDQRELVESSLNELTSTLK